MMSRRLMEPCLLLQGRYKLEHNNIGIQCDIDGALVSFRAL
jgi:hypothetical protein